MKTINQNRLSRLLGELAAAGVSFTVQDRQIRITGMDEPGWLPDWLERNQADLLVLLEVPDPEPPPTQSDHVPVVF